MICCISGYCLSLALELALMCDIRIVEESAAMQFSNRQLGIPLLNGGTQRLVQLVGISRAADLTLTGREFDANEAHKIGLTSYVVKDGTCKLKEFHLFGVEETKLMQCVCHRSGSSVEHSNAYDIVSAIDIKI